MCPEHVLLPVGRSSMQQVCFVPSIRVATCCKLFLCLSARLAFARAAWLSRVKVGHEQRRGVRCAVQAIDRGEHHASRASATQFNSAWFVKKEVAEGMCQGTMGIWRSAGLRRTHSSRGGYTESCMKLAAC